MNRCLACNVELPPANRAGGQRRLYCSVACRQAAYRGRRSARAALPDDRLQEFVDFAFVETDDPINGAAEVVVILRALVCRCHRLALVSPAQLRLRHEKTAQALNALLAEFWPVD